MIRLQQPASRVPPQAVSRAQTGRTLMPADLVKATCRWLPIGNAGRMSVRAAPRERGRST